MGICDFYVEIQGKTPEEAFAAAVARAKETYGDSSHTGSVAEKTGFIVIDDSIADVETVLDTRMKSISHERFYTPASDAGKYHHLKEEENSIRHQKKLFHARPKKKGRDKAHALAYALVAAHDERVNAPEKPAGIIRCTVGNWLIFGLAHE